MTVAPEIVWLAAGFAAGLLAGLAVGWLVLYRRRRAAGKENRKKAESQMLRPVLDALERFENRVQAMEQVRQNTYGSLAQQVSSLVDSQQDLHRETSKLVKALRQPQVRGRWGEMALRRAVETAGMQNHCDFFEQPASENENKMLRPDMIVKLPGGRQVVVDSKVPLSAYLDSLEDGGDGKEIERHAEQVRAHVYALARKSYWRSFDPSPEFVVMFIPGENFFSSALSVRPDIIEEAAARGVIPATPTTLIALLKAVAYSWRQETAAQNAREAVRLGNELYTRIYAMTEHFNRMGRDLDKCVTAYNRAAGSLERRVLASARKFREMGLAEDDRKELESCGEVENRPRQPERQDADAYSKKDP